MSTRARTRDSRLAERRDGVYPARLYGSHGQPIASGCTANVSAGGVYVLVEAYDARSPVPASGQVQLDLCRIVRVEHRGQGLGIALEFVRTLT